MIIGQGVYRNGHKVADEGSFAELASRSEGPESFVWVGLKEPSTAELEEAADAFGIHPLAIEDAQASHERPKVDLFGETLTLVLRSAAYDDAAERIEIGQITVMSSPGHVLVVRRGEGVSLTDLRSRMEADPQWLAQGPGVVLHAIIDTVVEAYLPVAAGIDNDIAEVEEAVFSTERDMPTRRIYELTREVLEFRKSAYPLTRVMETLTRVSHPMITDDIRRYLRGEAVLARPPSRRDRIAKFVARHKTEVAAAGAESWLLGQLGNRFQALHYVDDAGAIDAATAQALGQQAQGSVEVEPVVVARRGQAPAGLKTLIDTKGCVAQRYDLKPGTTYLARPDQHVAARWRAFDAGKLQAAVAKATCNA